MGGIAGSLGARRPRADDGVVGLILTVLTGGAGGPLAALLIVPIALHVAWVLGRAPVIVTR